MRLDERCPGEARHRAVPLMDEAHLPSTDRSGSVPSQSGFPLRRPFLAAVLAVALLPGCGGGGSSPASISATPQPTPRPQTVLTIRSGEEEDPVAGAVVVVSGSRLKTDATGHVTLPGSTRTGESLDILAPGFFDRLTTVPPSSSTVGLWPLRSPTGLDESFTERLVYTATEDGAPAGKEPLVRPRSPVYLVPSPDLKDDARAMEELRYAAARVREATGGQLPFSVTTSPPSQGIRFDVALDPDDPYCKGGFLAFCRRSTRGGAVTGGQIVFCRESSLYTLTMTHEVGHAFGLEHSIDQRDMMGVPYTRLRSRDFTPREQLAMRLMLERPPGNRYPDTDRGPAPAALRSETILCR